jgi:hypothetical protein
MNPTERIFAALEGRTLDRVPTFCPFLDPWPVQQVLGKPLFSDTIVFLNPFSRFIFDRWGPSLKKSVSDPALEKTNLKQIEAACRIGLDSIWALYDIRNIVKDSKTFIVSPGFYYDIIQDGHGNLTYMYRGPAISSEKEFDEWPYLHNNDDLAHSCYLFFKKAMPLYGDKICVMGEVSGGIQEVLFHLLGFEKFSLFIRKEPRFIQRLIDFFEEYKMKGYMAMMDAGVKVIMTGDDFAFKSGPMINPRIVDELFGPPYTRLTRAVHDRGGKILLHSCGDNTMLFDHFIKWGFDGGHAYENTSNVDIYREKEIHGDRFSIVGGPGVDYLLTERSTAAEVVDATRYMIDRLAQGGRFILSPVHAHGEMDMSKVRVMIETAREYGLGKS